MLRPPTGIIHSLFRMSILASAIAPAVAGEVGKVAPIGRRWARYPRMATIRLTEAEYAAIRERVAHEGTTVARWIRAEIDRALGEQANRQGNGPAEDPLSDSDASPCDDPPPPKRRRHDRAPRGRRVELCGPGVRVRVYPPPSSTRCGRDYAPLPR